MLAALARFSKLAELHGRPRCPACTLPGMISDRNPKWLSMFHP
jgi:hypothetical protein